MHTLLFPIFHGVFLQILLLMLLFKLINSKEQSPSSEANSSSASQ
jgi:hypothetical protein